MPHLHLPAEHSDADLVLAANLADVVGSRDLYVAWTHGGGAAVPEVQAVLRQQRPAPLLARVFDGFVQLWRLLLTGSQTPAPAAATVAPARARTSPPSA
jgi:hypothetical protein